MARHRKSGEQLRIYKNHGDWCMEYAGEYSEEVFHSEKGIWVGAYFRKVRGSFMVLTDRKRLVFKHLVGDVFDNAISDAGTAVIVEAGSGVHGRLRFFFPDGSSATHTKLKDLLGSCDRITFSPDGGKCSVTYAAGQEHVIQLADLKRSPKKAKPLKVASGFGCTTTCLIMVLMLVALGFAAYLFAQQHH